MKTELKQKLSKVKDFENPEIDLEQYITPPELAADLIHYAYMQGDIDQKDVVDLGAGTGILGIGAALAGGNVTVVEKSQEAIDILRENIKMFETDIEIINSDVDNFNGSFDTVIMNPPFSIHSEEGIDFWRTAVNISRNIYSVSPPGVRERIKDFIGNSSHVIKEVENYSISLPPTYGFHTREKHETKVDVISTTEENKNGN